MNNILIISSLLMLILLFMKVPVFIAILGGSAYYFVVNPDINTAMFAQQAITGVESISLLAIPFFVCAGVFMNYTGVTRRIMNFAEVLTARLPGGLGQVNVLLSSLMGGLSGSNIADAAMQSKMLVPEMVNKGFSLEFSSVITAVSSMITPLIPPGIAMILYGVIANVSIGKLFVSGLGVGLLLTIALMIMIGVISQQRGYGRTSEEGFTLNELWDAFKPAMLPLCLPIIIIGGIRIGVFTATEAGAVAVVYALFLGFVYGEIRIEDIIQGLKETVTTTASIMLIVSAASVFSWILTREQVPQKLTQYIVEVISNKYVFLLFLNIFLLIVGMFIEGNASMIILVPLLAPVAAQFGIDEIHFAMVYIFNSAIGALSPPMGTLMFVTCGITGCRTGAFIKEAVPYYIMLVGLLFLVSYFPPLTTGLVNLLY